ncbi:MAG TPA: sugar phosphate nucleotidyltransferase [Actinomycetota bacterium]|nr:sugar phosphate nucleotidyltransferase [Actinomycetota bacterium]
MPMAVIMAGGRGQRLRPLTDKVPKPLLRVGASSIIERIIASLVAAGIQDVYLAVNYKAEAFERRLGTGDHLGVNLHYLREQQRLGTAGALSLLPEGEVSGRSILVMAADILTGMNYRAFYEFHQAHGGAATVAAVPYAAKIPYAVLRTEGDQLMSLQEKPEQNVLCNAGIYMVQPEVVRLVPQESMIDMPDLLAKVLGEGLPVRIFTIRESWFDVGSPEDFEHVLHEYATSEED